MSFFRKVARDFARDIQVIITGEGGGKKKRQRYDPSKRKSKKGKFFRRLKKTYGDKASSLNTETQRDPGRKRGPCVACGGTKHWQDKDGWCKACLPPKCKKCRKARTLVGHTRMCSTCLERSLPRQGTSRDFAGELRTLSLQALGRLLNRAYQNGDDVKAHAIEREIDRRTKGKMLSRFSRRR